MIPGTRFAGGLATLLVLLAIAAITVALYAPGLGGGFVFDDYPNIVDNPAIQPKDASLARLTAAALSSPSSELKRPLASLTFAANYLATGLDAGAMKVTNLVIHLLNGLLLFALLRRLLPAGGSPLRGTRLTLLAGAMSLAWLTIPINLTAVLYVVQRMESLANLFVLIGLLGYVRERSRARGGWSSLVRAIAWIILPAVAGLMAKETAILLPLYALCVEVCIFRFRRPDGRTAQGLAWAYGLMLVPPLIAGSIWLGPGILDTKTWATRDFTLTTRLLSEPRILVDYLQWTIVPSGSDLSFYHDDFVQSTGWFTPWTTAVAIAALALLGIVAWLVRRTRPLLALGIALFFACHTLTATVLPLELVYEHRNYFASIGVILAVTDMFAWIVQRIPEQRWRHATLAAPALLLAWAMFVTFATANAWATPLGLAQELGRRGPESPRAQYELGRAYIIDSRYDPASPSTGRAYAPLEHAADLPGSSILPQQALIFLNARLNRPVNPAWWESMRRKLRERPATIQDESSLDALSTCLRRELCNFPADELDRAFQAATSHPRQSARLSAMYATFAWYTREDRVQGLRLQQQAVATAPGEGAYRITLIRMLTQAGQTTEASAQLPSLKALNIGGRYDNDIADLQNRIDHPAAASSTEP